jgi:hypothetical protein
VNGGGEPDALGQAGYGVTGSGGGGAGGQFVFTNLEELDGIITDLETLRDDIAKDGAKLRQARQVIVPPGEDIMSRMEATATVNSLDKALEHNLAMFTYAGAEIEKMRAARATYANSDEAGAAWLRNVAGG